MRGLDIDGLAVIPCRDLEVVVIEPAMNFYGLRIIGGRGMVDNIIEYLRHHDLYLETGQIVQTRAGTKAGDAFGGPRYFTGNGRHANGICFDGSARFYVGDFQAGDCKQGNIVLQRGIPVPTLEFSVEGNNASGQAAIFASGPAG